MHAITEHGNSQSSRLSTTAQYTQGNSHTLKSVRKTTSISVQVKMRMAIHVGTHSTLLSRSGRSSVTRSVLGMATNATSGNKVQDDQQHRRINMAKTQLELPAGEQCLGAIEEYYDHLPVRRGLASWIAWDL